MAVFLYFQTGFKFWGFPDGAVTKACDDSYLIFCGEQPLIDFQSQ